MFSVVIPLYNKELSIQNTILSVLNQSYQNFEIVVINDGSTDSSVDAVKSINDERVRLIHQENQGVSAARNRGIKEASYEWIAFLDGDDLWECNHLEEIVKMMKVFPENKVYVTSFEFSDKRKMFKHERKSPIFKIENYFKEAIKENLLWTSIVVVHAQCFLDVGGFNINLNRGEDLDLWARLARRYSIVKSTKITAIYNIEDIFSLTKSKSSYEKSILSIIDLYDKKGSERAYLKKMLINRIKLDIKTFDVKGLVRTLIKHNIELLK
ncbi:glycosyltransferase family 2 protein [Acinetobacter haemolyticus]|uniref:glycosyltransferase family 2 protein n=1 Tax=Acinetobacter haemolyticus TaxID=29430 RepID=UPI0034CEE0F1